MKSLLSILIIGTFCSIADVSGESQQRMCFFGKGNICDNDLAGYYECDGNDPWGRYHRCEKNQMCSCGIFHPCSKDQTLCVDRPEFRGSEIPEDFTVTFHGKLINGLPNSVETQSISGNIRQSLEKGNSVLREEIKYRYENGTEMKDVIRITQEEHRLHFGNAIIQYTYHKDAKSGNKSCTVRNTRGQVDFFHDLRKLSYRQQFKTDEYFFTDGPARNHAASTIKKWAFRQFHPSQPKCPSSFYKVKHGSNNLKGTKEEFIKFHYFYLTRPRPDYFRLPSECLKLIQYHDDQKKRQLNNLDDNNEKREEFNGERAIEIERELEMDFHKLF